MSYPSYSELKDSGIEWLGNIPKHWKLIQLRRCINRFVDYRGKTPSKTDYGIPLITAGAIKNGRVQHDKAPEYIAPENYDEWMVRGLPERGDVLVTTEAPLGESAQIEDENVALAQRIILLKANKQKITNNFLKYHFVSSFGKSELWSNATGSTALGIKADRFYATKLLVPLLEEQQAIAAFLDRKTAELDELIRLKEQQIELLGAKRQALISHAVTRGLDPSVKLRPSGIEWLGEIPAHWEAQRIVSFADKITNGYVGPTRDLFVEKGVTYLQSLHIKNNRIQFSPSYFVSEEWSQAHEKSVLREDDVLIVQTGDIGQVAVVPKEFEGANCHALIIVATRKMICLGSYLALCLNSDYGFHSLKAIQTGALHPHLNCTLVREIKIPIPPIEEQRKIIAYVEEQSSLLESLKQVIQEQIDRLIEYRQALISAAVTGKIDVRGVSV